MINALFITHRYHGYCGWLNDVYHMFYSSFNSAGLGHYKVFEYDFELMMHTDLDKSLVDLCKYNKFDVIIFISYWERFYKFTDNTWNYIKNELNIPIVYCYTDTTFNDCVYDHDKYADLIISHDIATIPEWLYLPPPQESGLYFDADIIRDTSIIFNCGLGHSERTELLNYIQNVGLPIQHGGGRWRINHYISPLEYAIDYMRSKLSICLLHQYREDTIQGHIYESMMCGCCTFISKSRLVETLFKKGVHYVEFTDKYDLADKLIYYLDNEDEANEIAKNGKIAVEKYNAYNFYNTMFINLDKACNKFNYKGH